MVKYVAALDVGTTGTRCLIFDTHGKELISQDLGLLKTVQHTLLLGDFSAGVYTLQLNVNGAIFHRNVIVGD